MKKEFLKKFTHGLIAIFIVLSMIGCSGDAESLTETPTNQTSESLTEPPTIMPLNQTLEYGAELEYSELISVEGGSLEEMELSISSSDLSGVTAGDESQTIVFENVGDYTIELSVTDEEGNESSCKVEVKVLDKTAPAINSEQESFSLSEVDSKGEYISGLTAYDEVDGDLTGKIEIDDSGVKYGEVGNYQVVAKVLDSSGNVCTQSYGVVIKDTTAPTLSLAKTSFSLTEGDDAPNYAGNATASDGVDGDVTSSIVVDDSKVDYDSAGTYEVTYKITDASGNSSTEKVTVKVKEKVTNTSSSSSSSSNSASSSSEKEVMITKTGECYHTHKCGNGNYFWVTFEEAQSRGLRACQKCY